MLDVWTVSRNTISDDSGFLYDAFTLRDGEVCKDMGLASGNSLIVFTSEELLMRRLILQQGLSFLDAADRQRFMPDFPPGYFPRTPFYQSDTRLTAVKSPNIKVGLQS